MKWSYVTSEYIEDGTKKLKCRFLWFPKYILYTNFGKSVCHWRWLEKAIWEERYTSSECKWVSLRWINGEGVKV